MIVGQVARDPFHRPELFDCFWDHGIASSRRQHCPVGFECHILQPGQVQAAIMVHNAQIQGATTHGVKNLRRAQLQQAQFHRRLTLAKTRDDAGYAGARDRRRYANQQSPAQRTL